MNDDMAAAAEQVLTHHEHADGMDQVTMSVAALVTSRPDIVRVHGDLHGVRPSEFDIWHRPNVTLRLSLVIDGEVSSRVYTVRRVVRSDAATCALRIEIELVRHSASSPAMRWLDSMPTGTTIDITGPREHQRPTLEGAERIAMFADASAMGAVYSLLEGWDTAVPATVHLAGVDPEVIADLPVVPSVRVVQHDASDHSALLEAARLDGLGPTVSVWAAGEREEMRALRTWSRDVVGVPNELIRIFGYWKRGVSSTELDGLRLLHAKTLLDTTGTMVGMDDFDIDGDTGG